MNFVAAGFFPLHRMNKFSPLHLNFLNQNYGVKLDNFVRKSKQTKAVSASVFHSSDVKSTVFFREQSEVESSDC